MKFTQLGNDLVNSYHLLLCSINLLYLNLVILPHNEAEIKNYKKNLLLVKIETASTAAKPNNNLLIDYLCRTFDGQVIETKTINEHYFKTQLLSLMEKKVFGFRYVDKYSDTNDFFSLIDLKNRTKFKTILNKLNKLYESFITSNDSTKCNTLSCMDATYTTDIDERQFINTNQHNQYNQYIQHDKRDLNNTSDLDETLEDETDSHNNSFIFHSDESVPVFSDRLVVPNCLLHLNKLKVNDLKRAIDFESFNLNLVEIELAALFRNAILTEYDLIRVS